MEYLSGYFIADGYYNNSKNYTQTSRGLMFTETKDEEFAQKLAKKYNGEYHHRQRVVKTGTVCDIYTVKFGQVASDYVRQNMEEYKNLKNYVQSLSSKGKDEFFKGFFDGDGTICRRKNSMLVGFYVVDEWVEQELDRYLLSKGIELHKNIDRRGHNVIQYNITNREDINTLMISWYGEVLLDRKYNLFLQNVRNTEWLLAEKGKEKVIFCDRKKCAEWLGKSTSTVADCLKGRNKNPQGYLVREVDFEEMVTLHGDMDELKPGEPSGEGCVQIRINNCMLTANLKSNGRAKSLEKGMGVQTIES